MGLLPNARSVDAGRREAIDRISSCRLQSDLLGVDLLTNAIKFGRVQVVLEQVSSNIELSFTGTGEGITPDFLPHVFERFRQGLTVLVVDDVPDARQLVGQLLEDCNATVRVAASASEALERLMVDPPDVIVSDIGMPGEDGYSLIRKIRSLKPEQGGNTPAIALTAYARAEDRINVMTAGFHHHVSKPVEPAELVTIASVPSRRA